MEFAMPLENGLYHFLDVVNAYRTVLSNVELNAGIVYYPGSGNDISVANVFGAERVLHVDIEPDLVDTLSSQGYAAECRDATAFVPRVPVSLLVMYYPEFGPQTPAKSVLSGNYVLCNNFMHCADWFYDQSDFEPVGVIPEKTGFKILETERLDDFWTPVETFKELVERSPKACGMTAEHVRDVVLSVNPDFQGDYVKRYAEFQGDSDGNLPPLPPKRGTADTMFVFKKL